MKETIQHNEMVAALAKDGELIRSEMTAEDAHLLHMGVGVCGEAGELIDAIKKKAIYRKELDMENVIEELGDLEFYMEGIRQALGITREQTIEANIKKLGERYSGYKYTDEAAQTRADKKEASTTRVKHGNFATNEHHFVTDEDISGMRDPFLILTCSCGEVEGLPVDQSRAHFGSFYVTYDSDDQVSPDGAFYSCKTCEDGHLPHTIQIEVDEGTEDDGQS